MSTPKPLHIFWIAFFLVFPLHGQDKRLESDVASLFLHMDYAYQSLKNSLETTNGAVQKKEEKFYKRHLKEALKFQKRLSRYFPYGQISTPSDRAFVARSLEVWGGVILRNRNSPNLEAFANERLNISPQRERFTALLQSFIRPEPSYTLPALNHCEQLLLDIRALQSQIGAAGDSNLPSRVRGRAKRSARKLTSSLNRTAAALADSFPSTAADDSAQTILAHYAGKRAFPRQAEPVIAQRLGEANYLMRLLKKAYFLPLDE